MTIGLSTNQSFFESEDGEIAQRFQVVVVEDNLQVVFEEVWSTRDLMPQPVCYWQKEEAYGLDAITVQQFAYAWGLAHTRDYLPGQVAKLVQFSLLAPHEPTRKEI